MTDGPSRHGTQELGREPGAPPERRRDVTWRIAGIALTLGALLVPVLILQWFATYFAIGYTSVATPEEGTRYVVTATACLVLLVGGTVAAIARGRAVLTGVGVVLTLLGVTVAVLLPVPSDRFETERTDPPSNSVPQCRSGGDSSDCLGG